MRALGWLAAAGMLLAPGICAAGAWPQEPGTAYWRLSAGYLTSDQRLDENGDEQSFLAGGGLRDVRYRDVDAGLYTEVGMHPRWTLMANVLWKRVEAEQPSAVFTTWGWSDLSVGLKGLVWRGRSSVVAGTGVLVFPLGYDPEEYPSLGSSVNEAHLGVQAGTATARYWANAEAWFKVRGGDFRNQVAGAVTAGVGSGGTVGLRVEARGEAPVGSTDPAAATPRFDPNLADPSKLDLASTVSLRLNRLLAVEAEARTTVWGKNTVDGTRFYLALATGSSLRLWSPAP